MSLKPKYLNVYQIKFCYEKVYDTTFYEIIQNEFFDK
jgi:hypothetical protein